MAPLWPHDRCPSAVVGSSPLPPRDGASLLLPVARVRDIIVWSGLGINGVQVVYDVGGEVVFGVKEMGSFGSYRQSKLTLDIEDGEVRASSHAERSSWAVHLHPCVAFFP